MKMKRNRVLSVLALMIVSLFLVSIFVASSEAARISKEELDALKKAGERTDEELKKASGAYEQEAAKALAGEGVATYGVVGYDYLTGIGKIGSTAKGTVLGDDPDALQPKFAGKRYATKWAVDMKSLDKGKSGWAKETGVTELWTRPADAAELGADYNNWVNNWNKASREGVGGYAKETLVAGADPNQGAHWFSFYCVHCHGWNGKGDGPTASALDPRPRNQTNGKYLNNITNLELFTVIKGGGEARELSSLMPPWGNVLQDQDIWNVVAFLRAIANPGYTASADEVTPVNAARSAEFKEAQEMLESEGFMAGRGGGLTGGFDSVGGGRLNSKKVGVSAKPSGLEKLKGENN